MKRAAVSSILRRCLLTELLAALREAVHAQKQPKKLGLEKSSNSNVDGVTYAFGGECFV